MKMLNLSRKKEVIMGIVLSLFIGLLASPLALANNTESLRGSLQVTGQAVITGTPDIAFITLGVETKNTLADVASQENADRMAKVFAALKNLGLTDQQLTTSGYNIYSSNQVIARGTEDEKTITNYHVENKIKITTPDLESVGKIVDVAIKAGANKVQGIQFDIKDKHSMQLKALNNAVIQAKEKATTMAEAAEITLGGITSMNENFSSYAPMVNTMALRTEAMSHSNTTINPGDVEVTATVSMNFWY